jgi:hypothetical protein
VRTFGVLLLLALLTPPLALGGHHHGTRDVARDCSTCIVAHCSPAEAACAVILPTVVGSQSALPPALPVATLSLDLPAHQGRAPPAVPGDIAA